MTGFFFLWQPGESRLCFYLFFKATTNVCLSDEALSHSQHASPRPLNRERRCQAHYCRFSVFVVHCGSLRMCHFSAVMAVYSAACEPCGL